MRHWYYTYRMEALLFSFIPYRQSRHQPHQGTEGNLLFFISLFHFLYFPPILLIWFYYWYGFIILFIHFFPFCLDSFLFYFSLPVLSFVCLFIYPSFHPSSLFSLTSNSRLSSGLSVSPPLSHWNKTHTQYICRNGPFYTNFIFLSCVNNLYKSRGLYYAQIYYLSIIMIISHISILSLLGPLSTYRLYFAKLLF